MKKAKTTLPPKIEVKGISMSENAYVVDGNSYDVPSLIQFAKEQGYPTFELPLAGINMENMPFTTEGFTGFCNHVYRVNNADLNCPIILDDNGYIADGWHRVAKAVILGSRTIKAVRLMKMPTPSNLSRDSNEG